VLLLPQSTFYLFVGAICRVGSFDSRLCKTDNLSALKKYFLDDQQMLLAVMANALIIFLLYFPEIRTNAFSLYQTLDFIDHLYVVIFALEAFFKIRHYGVKRYFKDGWNVFDFVIVVVSLPGFLHYLGFTNVIDTSIFQLLRLFRLARLIRFLKFIPNVKSSSGSKVKSRRCIVHDCRRSDIFYFCGIDRRYFWDVSRECSFC